MKVKKPKKRTVMDLLSVAKQGEYALNQHSEVLPENRGVNRRKKEGKHKKKYDEYF